MTVQKAVIFKHINCLGKELDNKEELILSVNEETGLYLIHRDLLRYQIQQQQGTVSTKTRSEVSGGGRKPWKQKGTGRARAGSNRSPLWKGGGVIFGPSIRKKVYKLNKKERNLSLQTLIFNRQEEFLVINELENYFKVPSTKEFYSICQNCGVDLNQKSLLIVSKKTNLLKLSVRNLENVTITSVNNLNAFEILKAKKILITELALKDLKEVLNE